jgi:hypothetical protein
VKEQRKHIEEVDRGVAKVYRRAVKGDHITSEKVKEVGIVG